MMVLIKKKKKSETYIHYYVVAICFVHVVRLKSGNNYIKVVTHKTLLTASFIGFMSD